LRKNVGAFVVDEVHLLDAKLADFLFAEILALAATRAARSTRTAGAAFTTRAMTAAGAMSATGVSSAGMTATAVTVTASTFAPRGRAGSCWCCCFLFLCHNHPFRLNR
jgi:hypothetical protein